MTRRASSSCAGAAISTLLSKPAVAVVGARACSSYGRSVARSLGRELAAAGLVVTSGMARGVDGEAHRGALEAGGITVAVLGCGIDRDYPAAHAELARRICERGLVVSEYEPGVEPAPWRFPARNRIIAGLCRATVVVEARERSGALITADFALEEGRDVLAVPGEITSALSAGTNALAEARRDAGHVRRRRPRALRHTAGEGRARRTSARPRRRILDRLGEGALTADEVVRASGVDPAAAAAALVELELARRIDARGRRLSRLGLGSLRDRGSPGAGRGRGGRRSASTKRRRPSRSRSSWGGGSRTRSRARSGLEQCVRRLAAGHETDGTLVAELDGVIVGMAVWGVDESGAGELVDLHVVPEAWGTGVARSLLQGR